VFQDFYVGVVSIRLSVQIIDTNECVHLNKWLILIVLINGRFKWLMMINST